MPHKSEDDARNGGEHFDEGRNRLPQPERRQFGEIDRRRDAEWHGDDQRDERGDERSVDERQRAELLGHRIPCRRDEEMETELPDRQHRAPGELPADEEDQRHHSERHPEGQPFKRPVTHPRRRGHSGASIQARQLPEWE